LAYKSENSQLTISQGSKYRFKELKVFFFLKKNYFYFAFLYVTKEKDLAPPSTPASIAIKTQGNH